jgi:hypothetical protein
VLDANEAFPSGAADPTRIQLIARQFDESYTAATLAELSALVLRILYSASPASAETVVRVLRAEVDWLLSRTAEGFVR